MTAGLRVGIAQYLLAVRQVARRPIAAREPARS